MNIQSVKLVYFSPTGTTKAIVQGIARGMNQKRIFEFIDITRPEARKQPLQTSEEELLVVAVPVYMGRVPSLLNEWLQEIQSNRTPAVCVVVYGNRAFEDALLELKDLLIKSGCIPVACASYIGEHSFHSVELPAASQGRPDLSDLDHAALFGRKIEEELQVIPSADHLRGIHVPGNYPYKGATELWHIDFIAVSDACTQCGICAEGCPTGAVDPENSAMIDKNKWKT